MKFMKYSIALILILSFCLGTFAQAVEKHTDKSSFNGVALSVLSRRWIPKQKVPYVGDDVIDFSDMIVKFRLENRCGVEIYYLADNVAGSIEPVGFQLSRRSKGEQWDAIYTPARGREGIFTGSDVRWLLLPPGCAVEFERTDLSYEKGQHATSVFINTAPEHKNRVEIISNTYLPLKKRGTLDQ